MIARLADSCCCQDSPDGERTMADERNVLTREMHSKLALVTLCVAFVVAVVCLAYIANTKRQSSTVITGNLQVAYMLITSKTATSEEASGSTINASQVEYFPNYVLVTTADGTTHLWPIERLKKLEVSRSASAGDK